MPLGERQLINLSVQHDRLTIFHRQAQELALHCLPQNVVQRSDESLESNLLRAWDLEHRKRIWARIFILDRFVRSVTLQRNLI